MNKLPDISDAMSVDELKSFFESTVGINATVPMTMSELADRLSVSVACVSNACRLLKVQTRGRGRHLLHGTAKKVRNARVKLFLEMRAEGETYEAIGKKFGISRQRVEQLVSGRDLMRSRRRREGMKR